MLLFKEIRALRGGIIICASEPVIRSIQKSTKKGQLTEVSMVNTLQDAVVLGQKMLEDKAALV
jgi:hypothetical protein